MRRNDEAHHSSSDDWPAGLEAKALELSREFLRLVDEVRHFFADNLGGVATLISNHRELKESVANVYAAPSRFIHRSRDFFNLLGEVRGKLTTDGAAVGNITGQAAPDLPSPTVLSQALREDQSKPKPPAKLIRSGVHAGFDTCCIVMGVRFAVRRDAAMQAKPGEGIGEPTQHNEH